jgi:hypothetical protein
MIFVAAHLQPGATRDLGLKSCSRYPDTAGWLLLFDGRLARSLGRYRLSGSVHEKPTLVRAEHNVSMSV